MNMWDFQNLGVYETHLNRKMLCKVESEEGSHMKGTSYLVNGSGAEKCTILGIVVVFDRSK